MHLLVNLSTLMMAGLASNGRLFDASTRHMIGLVPQVGIFCPPPSLPPSLPPSPGRSPLPHPHRPRDSHPLTPSLPTYLPPSLSPSLPPQDEALFPTLTVQETLLFSAELRLPTTMPQAAKKERVGQVGREGGRREGKGRKGKREGEAVVRHMPLWL